MINFFNIRRHLEHNMIILLLSFTFNTILVSGSSLSDQVYQNPPEIYNNQGETAKIKCSHSIESCNRILWYKQANRQLQFLGYMVGDIGKSETGVDVKIEGSAEKGQNCTLTTEKLNSSAVYFCAAGQGGREAYFGQGTKLTVLENNRDPEPPTVKVLPPSLNECRNKKDSKRKKTLVCVASEFYPDHVSVFWQIDGDNVTEGVATDDAALRPEGGRNYTITSRLRVSAEFWFTPTREFKCLVQFYNGKDYVIYEDSINGVEAPAKGNAITREKYLRVTQTAKLSYAVFIVKSSIYGAFVAFLVWKLQGKQNN